MPNFIKKIRPVTAKLLRAGGQTYKHDDANSRFSQFCENRLKHVITKNRSWLRQHVPGGSPFR